METLFLRVVWLSATVSAVLLPLLLASRWLQSRVKAKSLYLLWLLFALRLIVPVEITLPKPAVTVQVPEYEVTIPMNRPSAELPDDHQLSPIEPNVEPSLPQTKEEAQTSVPVAVVLGTLWLTGVFAIALIQVSSYLVTRRALLRWARPVSSETREQVEHLALVCAVLVGGLVACEQTQNSGPDQAVEELKNTITYDGQTLSFTLPEGERDWKLHIAGRAETDELGGISLHYLDETTWTPGETYSFDLDGESVGEVTELSMDIDLAGQSYTVNLLPHVREYSKAYPYYHNYDYGFTLTLPEGWAEGVDIREVDGGVEFYMKNAGDGDGLGWLVSIYLTDPVDWQGTADAGCPYGERFLGQSAQGVLFAAGPTDLPCDVTIPGALERYGTMYAEVDELLDSFQLDSIHDLVQVWLEEQVEQGPPEWAQGYNYLDGRVQSLKFQRMVLGYAVYEIEYRFLVDHPENVVIAGGMELDEEGWLRDYSMTAYLIVRNGSIEGVTLSDIAPDHPLFWYELPNLSEEEKWQAAAQVAYAGAEEWMRLYQGYIGGIGEHTFTREELAQAGYQAQTLPEQWKLVQRGGYPQSQNELLGAFQFYFSEALARRMIDEMFSGPDAPFLFYEGSLYFRDDVPCGEKIDGMGVAWSWSTFTITGHVEDVGVDGIDFTLSDNDAASGVEAGETWSFRLILEEDYTIRFHRWFDVQ